MGQDTQGLKRFEGAKPRAVERHSFGEAAPVEPCHHFAQTEAGLTALLAKPGRPLNLVLPAVLKWLIKIVKRTEALRDVEARNDSVPS